jgi:hypothetical protein
MVTVVSRTLSLLLALGLAVVTCEGGSDSSKNKAVGGSPSTSAGGNGTGGSGGDIFNEACDPVCIAPQFCSVSGACLDEGQCTDDGDCPTGSECTSAGTCTGCEPPNMLINLDRSCSMTGNVMGVSKWEIAVSAIDKLVTDNKDAIFFGLTMFPDTVTPACEQDAIAIPVGTGNEDPISMLLNAALVNSDPNFPNGPCVTNIDTAMQQAQLDEPAFNDVTTPGYVLLITDGKQAGCNKAGGDNGTEQIITDLWQQRSIATFVVGFGNGVDPAQLNVFANAGGVPTNDMSCDPPCNFYKAEDQASLDAALGAIAAAVSCDPDIQ